MRQPFEAGQGTVEFALLLVPLLLLVFGITDFSRVFSAKSDLEHGVREAAVFGTTHSGDGPGIRAQVEQQGRAGGFTITDEEIQVAYYDPTLQYRIGSYPSGAMAFEPASPCPSQLPAGACAYPVAGDYVQVSVAYPWAAATQLISDLLPRGFQIQVLASSRVQE
jgi:hypothetical protein